MRDISYEPREGEPLEGLSLKFRFDEDGAGCSVTVEQTVPDSGPAYDAYRERVGSGWDSSLADLKNYLEGPRRRRIVIEQGLPEN